ncbi:YfjI family protein [bacterium]|nr:YfjI family protein [bacterium]MDA7680628.1 YfjI family protein [bacterium]
MRTIDNIPTPEDFDLNGELHSEITTADIPIAPGSSEDSVPTETGSSSTCKSPVEKTSEAVSDTQKSSGELVKLHELHPTQAEQEPLDTFPIEVLPEPMKGFVEGISNSRQVPVALPAICALGVVSAAIGKGLRLEGGLPDISTPANLYLLVGASSGVGKSISSVRVASVLYAFEIESNIRIVCEDTTNEALIRALEKNNECLTSLSTDARDAIENLCGRYRDGSTDEGILLKAYSWEPHIVDRVKTDALRLRRPCLSITWLVQPDKIDLLFSQASLIEGGLLPRFLACQINAHPQKLDRTRKELPTELQNAWNVSVEDVLKSYRSLKSPEFVHIDEEAKSILDEYHETARQLQIGALKDRSEFVARYHENALRLALVIHTAAHGRNAHPKALNASTARNAVELHQWFTRRQIEILERGNAKIRECLEDRVLSLIDQNPQGIIKSEVYRKRIVNTADQADELLEEMVKIGKLRVNESKPPTGGHPVRRYLRKT